MIIPSLAAISRSQSDVICEISIFGDALLLKRPPILPKKPEIDE
jgi:hypothetical protein